MAKKYSQLFPKNYDMSGNNFFKENAKQCALIAVDEILTEIYSNNVITKLNTRLFWQQVKTEIQNL